MSDQANSNPATPSQTDAPQAADDEPLVPFQMCLSFGVLIGAVVGAIGGLVFGWMQFLQGDVLLLIPVAAFGGLIGGAVAGGIAGAIVGAIVHPIVMARRSTSPPTKPVQVPDDVV